MKKILTTSEMVEHTRINKRVIHDDIEYSKKFLLLNNYQNVISAHKHNFHSGKGDDEKHIYGSEVEFNKYVEEFNNERKDYPAIREKACMFEFYFKNLVTYYFFQEYNNYCKKNNILCDEINILSFLESRKKLCRIENLKFNHTKNINKVINNITKGNADNISPFVVFNSLHLTEIRFLFVTLSNNNRKKIVRELVNNNVLEIPGNNDRRLKNFEYSIGRLIGIRNVVVHNNSLTIYKKVNQNSYTKSRQQQKNYDVSKALKMYT